MGMKFDADDLIGSFEIDTQRILKAVRELYQPEDVYTMERLSAWARANGWVKCDAEEDRDGHTDTD